MVAYYFSFKTALVKGSPNVVSPNTSVLIYDVTDVNRVTPITAYSDVALTTITNLVSDQYGIVPDFYTNGKPDVLWKSGAFQGQWATSQSRPGLPGPTGPIGPQGIPGAQGNPGLNGAGTNAEIAPFVSGPGPTKTAIDGTVAEYVGQASATRTALDTRYSKAIDATGKMDKGSVVVNVLDYGAKGDWNPYTLTGTDDTDAIKAALAATPQGGTLFFPGFGNSRKYLISSQIDITTYNVRLLGAPRDTYASAIRSNAIITMFRVLAPGVIFENLGIEGGGGAITGVEVWGDTNGNCDTRFSGVCFTRLFVGARTRGRNVSFINECIFSICTEGVVIDGPDAVYHDATAGTMNRGYKIDGNLFHGNGSNTATGCIRIMPAAKSKYAVISNNSFDGGGKSTHVLAEGTSADPVQHLHITDNTHNDMNTGAYNLTWVQNSTINGANIHGTTSGANRSDTAITLSNCKWVNVSNVLGESIGRHGLRAVSSSYLWVSTVNFNTVGLDTAAVYDGFNVDSSNTVVQFDNLFVATAPGYGFNGSPGNVPSLENSRFFSCALGAMNSTTLNNRASAGRNVYTEGNGGRKQDSASKSYDLPLAGTAVPVATVIGMTPYTSFEVEVKVIGRNSAGNIYARIVKYVRPENGNPQYTVVGTDVIAGAVSVAFAASGLNGVSITAATNTSDAFVTVYVTALAGGGNTSAALRGVTVAMA